MEKLEKSLTKWLTKPKARIDLDEIQASHRVLSGVSPETVNKC